MSGFHYGGGILVLWKPNAMETKPPLPDGFGETLFKRFNKDCRKFTRGPLLLELFKEHYKPHEGKDFYEDLCTEMSEGDVEVWWLTSNRLSDEALLEHVRNFLMPAIRAGTAKSKRHNSIHVSDSLAEAERERRIWFD